MLCSHHTRAQKKDRHIEMMASILWPNTNHNQMHMETMNAMDAGTCARF